METIEPAKADDIPLMADLLILLCAVQRRWFSVGANPTRRLGHSSR